MPLTKGPLPPDDLERLLAQRRIDTLFGDQYLLRLRGALLAPLPVEAYHLAVRQRARLDNLPNLIRNAMHDGTWGKVRDLSREHELLKGTLEERSALLEIAAQVYEGETLAIDPFSPGMNAIPGVAKQSLAALRDQACHALETLARSDPAWSDFYRERLAVFTALEVEGSDANGLRRPSQSELENEALEALKEGNYARLTRLADDLSVSPQVGDPAAGAARGPGAARPELLVEFSAETVARAERLGLQALRVPSRRDELAPLCAFAWHPTFTPQQQGGAAIARLPEIELPQGTPEGLKERVQVFAAHPLVNSAGIRFLPDLVAEDVLVELFDEPRPGTPPPGSALLERLGLPQRQQLSRREIEAALLKFGSALLQDELGLDPRVFRLVCIPPDLYLRIGQERGWGAQQLWTHFDGYMVMMDGALRALAGGDVRFGGIYDLLGIGRGYDAERIIARFAIVQRRRMARGT